MASPTAHRRIAILMEAGTLEPMLSVIRGLILGALALVAGCAMQSHERYGEIIKVQWIPVETQREIVDKCGADGIVLIGGSSVNALSNFHPPSAANPDIRGCYREVGDVCVIYTLKPRTTYGAARSVHEADRPVMETVGHEIAHCYRGLYHSEG
jgi:hypothetical protein